MLKEYVEAVAAKEQYDSFKNEKSVLSSRILAFSGVDGFDTYNPSIPFTLNQKRLMAARVEKRDSEHSFVGFFALNENGGSFLESQRLELQDPFVTEIDGDVILGGVRVRFFSDRCEWTTDFYRMHSLDNIEFLFSGPKQMKDIRLLQLPDKRIAVFTRPQGQSMQERFGCVAKIGFLIVSSLEELNAEVIEEAPLLEGQFLPTEWGGANQLYNLKNGLIGVVGHKSYRTYNDDGEQRLHYYGMTFAVDPNTRFVTQTKTILSSDIFPSIEPKREDLRDVVFVSGIERNSDGTATAYTGISDAAIGTAEILDPLIEYENLLVDA